MLKDGIGNRARLARRTLGAFAVMATIAAPAAAAEQALIVLDASGSMWGQIGGQPKIVIAREVLDRVVGASASEPWLGLMAYGHREKGSCTDIELLYAPAPGSGPEIAGTVENINPKGKTPLSASVRMAAEALKYTEQKATVILITDGLETCHADPCALATELEETGVDFTTHVVGFGLSPEEGQQVACLADRTGGTYFQASDADGLADALTTSVAEAATAPEPEEPPAPVAELPEASLDAPGGVPIGTTFAVNWDGPGEKYDEIWLFDPTAGDGKGELVRGRRLSTSSGYDARTLSLVAPTTPGAYELRYTYGRNRDVIATRPIEVVEAEVSLDAPATVDIGATFDVDWVGPGGNRDSVQLFDDTAGSKGKVIAGARLSTHDFKNHKVTMTAPVEPGFYTLRYFSGDGRVLAVRQIEILTAEVSLSAPPAVDIGATFEVAWVGPGDNRDVVQIFDPKDGPKGNVVQSRRLANGDYKNRTVPMTAPVEPGEYELRYWNGDHGAVLATLAFTVQAADVSVKAPATADMGTIFAVAWTGPGGNRDRIEVFDPKGGPKGKVVSALRLANGDYKNRTVELIAPIRPGDYILRYWNGDHGTVLAEAPLTVVETAVAISGPDSVEAGARFEVEWQGPGARRDSVEILDASGNAVGGQRILNGDYANRTVTLRAPKAPGSYTLRYWHGDSGVQLAEQPIAVR